MSKSKPSSLHNGRPNLPSFIPPVGVHNPLVSQIRRTEPLPGDPFSEIGVDRSHPVQNLPRDKQVMRTLELMAVNGLVATFASPLGAVQMQNLMAQQALHSNRKLLHVAIDTVRSGMLLRGCLPFSYRQGLSSGLGFSGTDALAVNALSFLPTGIRSVVAGTLMGTLESFLTGKQEAQELSQMLNQPTVSLKQVIKGTIPRNACGWTAADLAGEISKRYNLSVEESALLGFAGGVAAGIGSMPLQQGIVHAAKYGVSIEKSYTQVLKRPLQQIFQGAIWRAGILGFYTAVAMGAMRYVDRAKSSEVALQNASCAPLNESLGKSKG